MTAQENICREALAAPGAPLRTSVSLLRQMNPRGAWFGQDDR